MFKTGTRLLLGAALLACAPLFSAQPAQPSPGANADSANPGADPLFREPVIDKDEWRDAPVRHRYVHGYFKGTELRFSFYMPPKEQYQGRFFQHLTPVPDSENLAQAKGINPEEDKIAFSAASGAIFVETNGGGPNFPTTLSSGLDQTITAYRANAAAARFARATAQAMYGAHRTYGYAYGGSGGAYRTIGSFENTRGVWDGTVPYVMGSSMAIPNMFSVRMHAMRLIGSKFDGIVDALDAGGSGDPYAGLDEEQASALREVTRMGFQPQAWFGWRTMGVHAFTVLYPGMVQADPGYFEDFWTKPGYYGFDHPESFAKARLQFKTTISAPLDPDQAEAAGLGVQRIPGTARGAADTAWQTLVRDGSQRPVAYRLLDTPPDVGFMGGDLVVLTGAAAGKRIGVREIKGDAAILGVASPAVLAQIKPGDDVQLDNSNFLAAQTFHRHQVPGPEFYVWDQFRGADGKPIYPQRPRLLGPSFTRNASGSLPEGDWQGKMIVVESLWDREAMPWSADWYRAKVRAHQGPGYERNYRLWYTDRALHGADIRQEDETRTVTYQPVLQQALRDLAAWVERGVPPPATTGYTVADGQIVPAATARQRRGVQPVVTVAANGGARAEVAAGQPVRFTGTIEAPPGAGHVVRAEWDFEGKGAYPVSSPVPDRRAKVAVAATYTFARPGTYFAVLRGSTHRTGDKTTPFARIRNLARARVVVK